MTTNTNPKGIRAGIAGIKSGVTNIIGAAKLISRDGREQLKDEIAIAKHELKTKGIAVGKGAAFLVVAVVFALLLTIALVSAIILGLSTVMPGWAAALLVSLVFLIILAICALIGIKRVKAELPFKPESAIFGVLFDLGVLKEGSAMTAERLSAEIQERAEAKRQAAEEAAEKARQEAEERKARGEEEPKPPTIEEIKARAAERRTYLASLRDQLEVDANGVQAGTEHLIAGVKAIPSEVATEVSQAGKRLQQNISKPEVVKARWVSFTALGVSLTAAVSFLRKLLRR
ncbi:MAG: phage holin family protein [Rothia sp. (in: high G+C Gram-positive bacteria)]|uniref:phage holin family protein n=1 Tax=Rothia sp. (in: high G+C Gram-positive bacteria) TaxID=1885016 RepID=UPI0026E04B20|nr:phage holin family protein [Rothia sp. (in: high G+C Gram-positive bacteria)]MDO5750366.1 phage holin family protein [Rothia sp. (in: high G+C Gram-positive bacteria)]